MDVTANKSRAGSQTRESAQGIANHYGVSRRKVLDWYYTGIIPACVHVGRVLRFDPVEVEVALRKATKDS